MSVKLPEAVYDGIEAVRKSGRTNMLDFTTVINLCFAWGYHDAAYWILGHHKEYSQLIFEGMEAGK